MRTRPLAQSTDATPSIHLPIAAEPRSRPPATRWCGRPCRGGTLCSTCNPQHGLTLSPRPPLGCVAAPLRCVLSSVRRRWVGVPGTVPPRSRSQYRKDPKVPKPLTHSPDTTPDHDYCRTCAAPCWQQPPLIVGDACWGLTTAQRGPQLGQRAIPLHDRFRFIASTWWPLPAQAATNMLKLLCRAGVCACVRGCGTAGGGTGREGAAVHPVRHSDGHGVSLAV